MTIPNIESLDPGTSTAARQDFFQQSHHHDAIQVSNSHYCRWWVIFLFVDRYFGKSSNLRNIVQMGNHQLENMIKIIFGSQWLKPMSLGHLRFLKILGVMAILKKEPVGQIMSGPRATQLHGSDLKKLNVTYLEDHPRYRKWLGSPPWK